MSPHHTEIIVMGCDAEDHPWPATTLTIEPRAPAPVPRPSGTVHPIKIVVLTTRDFKHILEHEEQ